MKYSKRKYRGNTIEVIEDIVVTKKKKKKVLKEGFFKKMIKKVKSFLRENNYY